MKLSATYNHSIKKTTTLNLTIGITIFLISHKKRQACRIQHINLVSLLERRQKSPFCELRSLSTRCFGSESIILNTQYDNGLPGSEYDGTFKKRVETGLRGATGRRESEW